MGKWMAVLLALVLTACASSGTKMDASKLDAISIGETTKPEMIQMFGKPLAQSYDSDGHLALTWYYVHVGAFGTNMQQQSLVALFNDDGTLEKYNLIDGASPGARLGY